MRSSYTAPAKAVKPRHTAGYTITWRGIRLRVRASHLVIVALLQALMQTEGAIA